MRIEGRRVQMTRGDSESLRVACQREDNSARPFQEGDTLYFTVKRSAYSQEKELQKIITRFEEDGTALIALLPEDTRALPYGRYWYDLQLTAGDGQVTTIVPPSEFWLTEEITYE